MSKFIAVLICLAVGIVGVWLYATPEKTGDTAPVTNAQTDTQREPSDDNHGLISRQPSKPDRQVYVNQDWRFSFEYPNDDDWKIREPAFGSATTLFNLAIWPEEENILDPVSINFTPKWWIDRLLDRKEGDVMIGGKPGWYYQSTTMSVIPQMAYFVLINDEYWINISIQNEYLGDFQMVLDTFEFHEPLPALDELDVDPYIPDHLDDTNQI